MRNSNPTEPLPYDIRDWKDPNEALISCLVWLVAISAKDRIKSSKTSHYEDLIPILISTRGTLAHFFTASITRPLRDIGRLDTRQTAQRRITSGWLMRPPSNKRKWAQDDLEEVGELLKSKIDRRRFSSALCILLAIA